MAMPRIGIEKQKPSREIRGDLPTDCTEPGQEVNGSSFPEVKSSRWMLAGRSEPKDAGSGSDKYKLPGYDSFRSCPSDTKCICASSGLDGDRQTPTHFCQLQRIRMLEWKLAYPLQRCILSAHGFLRAIALSLGRGLDLEQPSHSPLPCVY